MEPAEAETQLRAIRLMIERATMYRAVSAPSALCGGALALVTATCQWLALRRDGVRDDAIIFYCVWLGVLTLTAAANTLFLWRSARQRGEPFTSPVMWLALRSLVPSFLAGGLLSFCVTLTSSQPLLVVVFWLIFYGLSLLATMNFAPGSIVVLGWAFLLTGLALCVFLFYRSILPDMGLPMPMRGWPSLCMGVTFGGYHLVYAACIWPRHCRVLEAIERRPLVHH